MITITDTFVARVRNGSSDDHKYNDALSSVDHDGHVYYYDLTRLPQIPTKQTFRSFAEEQFGDRLTITEKAPCAWHVSVI